jgi:rsbT co-antagonist protein RsbR
LYYGRVWYFRDITERQRAKETIRLLSTPVLPIRNQLLILPVIGEIDLDRVRQLGEQLMSSVRDQRAKVVVLDITGVPYIESEPLNRLVEIVKSTQLMGANLIITGVSTEISKGLVEKGNLLGEVRCLGDLQSGIEEAERMLGYQVTHHGRSGPRKSREPLTSSLRSTENRAKIGSPAPVRK